MNNPYVYAQTVDHPITFIVKLAKRTRLHHPTPSPIDASPVLIKAISTSFNSFVLDSIQVSCCAFHALVLRQVHLAEPTNQRKGNSHRVALLIQTESLTWIPPHDHSRPNNVNHFIHWNLAKLIVDHTTNPLVVPCCKSHANRLNALFKSTPLPSNGHTQYHDFTHAHLFHRPHILLSRRYNPPVNPSLEIGTPIFKPHTLTLLSRSPSYIDIPSPIEEKSDPSPHPSTSVENKTTSNTNGSKRIKNTQRQKLGYSLRDLKPLQSLPPPNATKAKARSVSSTTTNSSIRSPSVIRHHRTQSNVDQSPSESSTSRRPSTSQSPKATSPSTSASNSDVSSNQPMSPSFYSDDSTLNESLLNLVTSSDASSNAHSPHTDETYSPSDSQSSLSHPSQVSTLLDPSNPESSGSDTETEEDPLLHATEHQLIDVHLRDQLILLRHLKLKNATHAKRRHFLSYICTSAMKLDQPPVFILSEIHFPSSLLIEHLLQCHAIDLDFLTFHKTPSQQRCSIPECIFDPNEDTFSFSPNAEENFSYDDQLNAISNAIKTNLPNATTRLEHETSKTEEFTDTIIDYSLLCL